MSGDMFGCHNVITGRPTECIKVDSTSKFNKRRKAKGMQTGEDERKLTF